jgi:hypothetical protein
VAGQPYREELVRRLRLGGTPVAVEHGGHSIESAGFDLLLVHPDEAVATMDTTEPMWITVEGLQWPRHLRSGPL